MVFVLSTRSSTGHGFEAPPMSRPAALFVGELAGFLGQHDRNAVADRIGESGFATDQLLPFAIVDQRRLRHRADENLEKLGIDVHGFDSRTPTPPLWRGRKITE